MVLRSRAHLGPSRIFLSSSAGRCARELRRLSPEKSSTYPLDELDRRILTELQRDAGITNQELADRVGLSPSPCLRRVKALEDAGVLQKRVALLDRKQLGLTLTALIQISMDRHTPERF